MKMTQTFLYSLLLAAVSLSAQVVQSPDVPFGNTAFFGPLQTAIRYQQVYAASDFGLVSAGAYITQIAFHYEPQTAFFGGATASNVLVKLSTTQKTVDGLASTFSENVGLDEMVVYGVGPVVMPPGDRPGFDVYINLTTHFLYNPQAGNLLLEIQNFGGFGPPVADPVFLDGHNDISDSVSRLAASNPNGLTGSPGSGGLRTQFTFVPIPEPSTTALSGGASVILLAYRFRIRRKANTHGINGRITA